MGRYLKDRRARYNKFFSGVRISVERAFGILKARFQALAQKMDFRGLDAIDMYRRCFIACAILHNICAEMKIVRLSPAHLRVYSSFPLLTPSPFPPFLTERAK
jgi:hypothetical protein